MNSPKHPNHSVHVALGVVLPLILLGAGAALLYFAEKPEPPKIAGIGDDSASLLSVMPAAQVQQVLALTEPLDLTAAGVVVPFREIVLAAEVAGRVVEKDPSVRAGNQVQKGQMLLRIDPRDYQLDVNRLEQRLEQEKVSLSENEQEMANTARLVEVAHAQLALAEADYERTKQLGQSFASQSELGSARQAVLTAMNQKVSLENQLLTLRTRAQRLELAIRMGETELDQAHINLQRTEIRSPVDGVVVREQFENDSYVGRGMELVTIEDISKAEIACSLRMDQLFWILDQSSVSQERIVNSKLASLQKLPKIDALIRFRVAGRQSMVYEWSGRLDRVEGTGLDPQSRMVPIRVVIDNPAEYRVNHQPSSDTSMSLVRGMFVDVVLKAQPATQLLLVPKSSVKPATGSYRIWKFDPDPSAFQVVRRRHGFGLDGSGQIFSVSERESAVPLQDAERTVDLDGNGDLASNDAPEMNSEASTNDLSRPDPLAWEAGFLRVMEGIEVLGTYQGTMGDNTEYWICDAARTDILPGDYVVVTPIPGIDTTEEPIRVAKKDMQARRQSSEASIPTHSSVRSNSESEPARNLQ